LWRAKRLWGRFSPNTLVYPATPATDCCTLIIIIIIIIMIRDWQNRLLLVGPVIVESVSLRPKKQTPSCKTTSYRLSRLRIQYSAR
jgi:hypothetical protein